MCYIALYGTFLFLRVLINCTKALDVLNSLGGNGMKIVYKLRHLKMRFINYVSSALIFFFT